MLGALAAIALVVGGISTATVLTDDTRTAQEPREAVVEVQAVQPADESQGDAIRF